MTYDKNNKEIIVIFLAFFLETFFGALKSKKIKVLLFIF